MFITFEGIDGSGKSEQAIRCVKFLSKNFDVVHCFDPGHTPIGNAVRSILLNKDHMEMDSRTELLLYAAARSQLVSEVINPHLQNGDMVVSDRFYDSTTAYQGYGRKLPLDLIHQLNMIGAHELIPDLTFIIDTNLDVSSKRVGIADRLESENREFKSRVRLGYLALAEKEPDRCKIIDGNRSIEEIHADIIAILQKELEK
ncbi:MAG: dTMP kinase [Candidatus Marinimicrobia bacterium]|nr:dTMP kinase [Candidatus Neomarinimicrobiota bacterium]